MGRVAAALSSLYRAVSSPPTHAAWRRGTSFLFCFRRDSWDAASTSETYGPGTLPDRSSLGIESETTQTDIGQRRPAGSALLTRGSRLRVGRANPTNSGLFHRMCACWKRHNACKLPHQNGERVVMFQRAGKQCKMGHRNRVDRVDGTFSSSRPRLNSHDVPPRSFYGEG